MTYGLEPRTVGGILREKLNMLLVAAAALAIGVVVDRLPLPRSVTNAIGPLMIALFLVIGAVLTIGLTAAIVAGFDRKYRASFRVTVSPNGVRRESSNRAEPDVFFPRSEITGYYDSKYFVRVLTADPLRHLQIPRDLARMDAFKAELQSHGIMPIAAPSNFSPALRPIWIGLLLVLAGIVAHPLQTSIRQF